jgi:dTDP-4-dehydrorhamnose 3,5-epimerase
MLHIRRLAIPEILEITIDRHCDHRGFFSEVWSAATLAAHGIDIAFVQDNHSHSAPAGVLRGLHYQEPPFAQAKLIRVARGAIFDVAVDIRSGSPTFGRWAGLVISARAWNQMLIPPGFAHGFVTLEPETDMLYKISAPYSASHERSIRFDDPEIGIEWPLDGRMPILSERDACAPALCEVAPAFRFDPSG